MSSILLEVYRCVQLNRWSVVCGCVLQRGEVTCVSLTLCMYDIRMGLYWFGVGRGCDVFLWGGIVRKRRS